MARKSAAIADFRRELTQRTSVTQLSQPHPSELAEAVSEPHELETRAVQGVVVGERRARAGSRFNRLWLVAAGLFAASLGMVARRAFSPSDDPKTASVTPIASARPSLTTVHAAAPLPSASPAPAAALEEPAEPLRAVPPTPRPAPARPAREVRTTARTAAAAPNSGPCTPPTYTDDEGIRHFKVGCI